MNESTEISKIETDDSKTNWKKELLNWNIISKNRNLLFGIAILWIMMMHSFEYDGIKGWFAFKKVKHLVGIYNAVRVGGIGVDIFLFLSGIGLFYSFSSCPDIKKFYLKRLHRIVIPYLILGGAYLFFINILAGKDVVEFFKDLGWITYYKDGVATYWYINFILIMYLIYPLIYRLLEGRYRNLSLAGMLALAFLLIYLVYSYNFTLYDNIEQSLTRIPIFIIGCYWGRLVKDKRPIREFWIIYALVIPWLGGILQYIGYRDIFPWTVSRRIWYGMMAISICILFSLLLSIAELKYIKKFLNFAGTLSLELYLSHIAMKGVLKRIFPHWAKWSMTKSCFRYFVGVVVASFLISVVYHFLSDRIGRKIKYRK